MFLKHGRANFTKEMIFIFVGIFIIDAFAAFFTVAQDWHSFHPIFSWLFLLPMPFSSVQHNDGNNSRCWQDTLCPAQ
jgi:hypothetical protein